MSGDQGSKEQRPRREDRVSSAVCCRLGARTRQPESPRGRLDAHLNRAPGANRSTVSTPGRRTSRRPRVSDSLNVRFASPDDRRALERVVQRDSARPPRIPARVAELDGELVAALPLSDGEPIADPFRPTAELVRVLELRAAQLRGRNGRPRRGLRDRVLGRRPAIPGARQRSSETSPTPSIPPPSPGAGAGASDDTPVGDASPAPGSIRP